MVSLRRLMRTDTPPLLVVAGLAALPCGCGRSPGEHASQLAAPSVPEALRPGEGEVLTAKLSAQGTQNYECQAGEGASYAWKLVGPDADLRDAANQVVGRHVAGPTWAGTDGSKVVGEVRAKEDAPGGQAVPWLLLKAKSASGAGTFGKVTTIQRLDTEGGLAPAAGCDAAHAGARQNVPYRATYYFYR